MSGAKEIQKGFNLTKNELSLNKVVPLSTLTSNIVLSKHNGNTSTKNEAVLTTHNAITSTNVLSTEDKRDPSRKRAHTNNVNSFYNCVKNIYPLQVENGKNMFTKMKINPNIQVLLKDFRYNVKNTKNVEIASIFKKK